jgi:hypothetical protein
MNPLLKMVVNEIICLFISYRTADLGIINQIADLLASVYGSILLGRRREAGKAVGQMIGCSVRIKPD